MMTDMAESVQYLTFTLDDEVFGLDIGRVREVLEFTQVTRVPRMPEFMLGVINLRGGVVPVVDLRRKFGMPPTERTVETCVIIAEAAVDGETTVLGAVADSVQEVAELGAEGLEPPPRIGEKLRTDFLKGMGKQDDRFILLLDIDRVFSLDELASVQAGSGGQSEKAA